MVEPAVMEMMEAAVMKAIPMKSVSAMEAATTMLRVASVCDTCHHQTGQQRQKELFHVGLRKIAPVSEAFRWRQ